MPRGMKKGMGKKMMGPMADPRSRFFMALACDQRLKIVQILKDGEKSSAEIISAMTLDSSVISRHLMILRNVGLVAARKAGVTVFFRIADNRVFEIIDQATTIIKDWFDQHRQFFE